MKPKISLLLLILLCLLSLSACGYHLRGGGSNLPEGISAIAILPIENDTYEADMSSLLERSLAEEFSKSKDLKLVSEDKADALLVGKIVSFDNRPISFSSEDQARDYRVEIVVDAKLVKKVDDEVLWKGKGLKETQEYAVVPGDVSLAEVNKGQAKEALADEVAELIYDMIVEGF